MIVVTGTIEIHEKDIEIMKRHATTMAVATRDEPGCIKYAFFQDIEKPNRFRVYEEWDDRDSLRAHGETPHMAEFRKALGKAGIISRDIVSFEPGEITPL